MSGAALRAAVERAATILVASEPLPDGDAFGSEVALRLMIQQTFGLAASRAEGRAGQGPKFVQVLNERGIPERYAFLEGATGRAPGREDEAGYDLGILVDGGVERTGLAVRAVYERCRARAYVDHHRAGSAAPYDVKIVQPTSASTTEAIFSLLDGDGWSDVKIDRPLAEALYVGLVADTGSFMYSLTTPRTHRVAARLLEAGVRTTFIAEKVLLDVKLEDLELEAKVVLALEREHGGRLLVGVLSLDMLAGRDPRLVAYDKIVTPIAFVEGTTVTLLLREVDPRVWKLSFRSRGGVDVSKVAREIDPQGGGHERAAGCELRGPLEDVKRVAVAAIGRALG
ncbi:MAG TPA: DHH family phosphoesterase [Planctomycetota bacterium]|nr:DHH family phosphoesterase [Planctomycetota bacterium]